MRSFFLPLDHQRVKEQGYRNVENADFQRKRVAAWTLDNEKVKRLQRRACKYCFYLTGGRMAGQAFTNWSCGVCGKDQMYHCTATPKVCTECSDKWELCCECGGDIEDRWQRKQKWPELTKEQIEEIRARDGRSLQAAPSVPEEQAPGGGS